MNNSWNSKENSYCIFSFITNYWPKFHYFDYVICCGCYFQQATLHKTLDASPLIWTESKFTKTNCKCNRIPKVGQQNFKASPHQMPNFASHQFFSLCLGNWKAQSKNDLLIFRPFLKVFRSSCQLLLNTFKNGQKIKGSFLLWALQLRFPPIKSLSYTIYLLY